MFEDAIRAFVCKIILWTNKKYLTCQMLFNDDQYANIRIEIQHNIKKSSGNINK